MVSHQERGICTASCTILFNTASATGHEHSFMQSMVDMIREGKTFINQS